MSGVHEFLTSAIVVVNGQLHAPTDRRLGGPHTRCGHCEEHNLLCLIEIEPRFIGHPARSLVTVPCELPWFSRFTSQSIKSYDDQMQNQLMI
jgi:hypothetical protein